MLPLLCPRHAGQSNVCPWPEQENGLMIPHHSRGPRTDIIIVPTCMVDSDGDADIDEAGRRVGGALAKQCTDHTRDRARRD